MEFWFSYKVRLGTSILRIGKSHCFAKTEESAAAVLRKRYNYFDWDGFEYNWHISEAAALKRERYNMATYIARYGVLPPFNHRDAGGGRQMYYKCKAYKRDNSPCPNDARISNYGYCYVHRRVY